MTGELLAVWGELAATEGPPGLVRRRYLPGTPFNVYLAVELPGRARLFYVGLPTKVLAHHATSLPQSAGISVRIEPDINQPGSSSLFVRLESAAYSDVFAALASDLLAVMAAARNEGAAADAFIARLHRWQKLLARHGPEGLSPDEQCGLFGELFFIREYLANAVAPPRALDAWTGPLAGDQDFQLPACSVEVKTSRASPEQVVHVSNVRQLDETASPSGALFLFHLALEARHGQGETLPSIVESVRTVLAPMQDRFDELIEEAGYLAAHAFRYEQTGYVVKSHQFFTIGGAFPRIIESELRAGVGTVRYVVQLGACQSFLATDSLVVERLKVT